MGVINALPLVEEVVNALPLVEASEGGPDIGYSHLSRDQHTVPGHVEQGHGQGLAILPLSGEFPLIFSLLKCH